MKRSVPKRTLPNILPPTAPMRNGAEALFERGKSESPSSLDIIPFFLISAYIKAPVGKPESIPDATMQSPAGESEKNLATPCIFEKIAYSRGSIILYVAQKIITDGITALDESVSASVTERAVLSHIASAQYERYAESKKKTVLVMLIFLREVLILRVLFINLIQPI